VGRVQAQQLRQSLAAEARGRADAEQTTLALRTQVDEAAKQVLLPLSPPSVSLPLSLSLSPSLTSLTAHPPPPWTSRCSSLYHLPPSPSLSLSHSPSLTSMDQQAAAAAAGAVPEGAVEALEAAVAALKAEKDTLTHDMDTNRKKYLVVCGHKPPPPTMLSVTRLYDATGWYRPQTGACASEDGRYSDGKVANRDGRDFGWEIAHAAVSRRPPISRARIVSPYSQVDVRHESLGFDHSSKTIFCRPVPNLSVAIRSFFASLYKKGTWATRVCPSDGRGGRQAAKKKKTEFEETTAALQVEKEALEAKLQAAAAAAAVVVAAPTEGAADLQARVEKLQAEVETLRGASLLRADHGGASLVDYKDPFAFEIPVE
jgi:hypothetical protein